MYYLYCKFRKGRQARKQQEGGFNFRLIPTAFLFGLVFNPEDGGDTFFRNVSVYLPDYMALSSGI
jgi:hypothetical protein